MKAVKDYAPVQYEEPVYREKTGEAPLTAIEIRVLETLVHIQESIKGILWPRKYGPEARYITPGEFQRRIDDYHRERALIRDQESRQEPGQECRPLTKDPNLKIYFRHKRFWFPQVPRHKKHPILSLLFLSPAVFVFALFSPRYRKCVSHILYRFGTNKEEAPDA